MMINEFTELIGKTVSPDDYNTIETVYMYYPGIETKTDIANIYKIGGMLMVKDLYKRASAIMEATNRKVEMKTIQERVMEQRKKEGLKVTLKDGFTYYAKDKASKDNFIRRAKKAGRL